MASFYFNKKAVEDLTNIWDYTRKIWSENQAEIYYNLILKSCQDLAYNPFLGRNYYEIELNVLGFKANKHIIFYRIEENNEIEIVRILHSSMDLQIRIKE
jgi:toxin ParE1/3/4